MIRLPLVLLSLLGLLAAGCSERGPDLAARGFVERLSVYQGSPFPDALKAVYEVLDTGTQQALVARANMLSESVGGELKPWEALSYRGLTDGVRVTDYEVIEQTEASATVELRFKAIVPEVQGGPAESPKPLRLAMRMERGEWRFILPLEAK